MTTGKDGLLELEVLPSGPGRRRVRAPLSLGRILHVDPILPKAQVVYIRATGGGLAQGDKTRTSITVRQGAHAVVTSQTATRIHSMTDGDARQTTDLSVDTGGVLEYLPDPIIPSRDSQFSQRTTVRVADGAIAIVGDCFTAGRVAHGEFHDADRIDIRAELHTSISQPVGVPAYLERASYSGKADLNSAINHRNFRTWANLWVVCPAGLAHDVLNSWTGYPTDTTVGASSLPGGNGCWARFMGDSIEHVVQLQHQYWDNARRIVLGAPAFDLRKM